MKKGCIWALFIAFLLVAIAICSPRVLASLRFQAVRCLSGFGEKRTGQVCRALSRQLSDTEEGVELAVADLDCYGGRTSGYSNWILLTSRLHGTVRSRLEEIAENDAQSLERRVAACEILWRRTDEDRWLERSFELAQPGGSPVVSYARAGLREVFVAGDSPKAIDVPDSQDLPVSVEDFRGIVQRYRSSPFYESTYGADK